MINIEELKAVRTIVTHKDCPDGIASALILHDVLPGAEIVFMQYGTPELGALEAAPGMLFCDFSPPAERAAEFVHAKAIVLDHHRTAKPVVEAFGSRGVFADEQIEPGVSGAALAFRDVWTPLTAGELEPPGWSERRGSVSSFAHLASIRDTWQRDSALWLSACSQAEALRFWPWEKWLSTPWRGWLDLMRIGPVLLDKKAGDVAEAVRTACRFVTDRGNRVVVFQGVSETSDAAELLGDEADLVMGFRYVVDGEPKLIWSCRSRGDFDVAALAKFCGGGGHTKAAGFSQPLGTATGFATEPNPFTAAALLVSNFVRSGTR